MLPKTTNGISRRLLLKGLWKNDNRVKESYSKIEMVSSQRGSNSRPFAYEANALPLCYGSHAVGGPGDNYYLTLLNSHPMQGLQLYLLSHFLCTVGNCCTNFRVCYNWNLKLFAHLDEHHNYHLMKSNIQKRFLVFFFSLTTLKFYKKHKFLCL